MRIATLANNRGTPMGRFRCEACGRVFDVTPNPKDDAAWAGCLSPNCASYDPDRDAEGYFEGKGGA